MLAHNAYLRRKIRNSNNLMYCIHISSVIKELAPFQIRNRIYPFELESRTIAGKDIDFRHCSVLISSLLAHFIPYIIHNYTRIEFHRFTGGGMNVHRK